MNCLRNFFRLIVLAALAATSYFAYTVVDECYGCNNNNWNSNDVFTYIVGYPCILFCILVLSCCLDFTCKLLFLIANIAATGYGWAIEGEHMSDIQHTAWIGDVSIAMTCTLMTAFICCKSKKKD